MKIENMAALRDELEQMETPQLDAMLLEELGKEPPNAELLHLISSILKERDRELIPTVDANIQQAWEQYQRKTQQVYREPKPISKILVYAASFLLVILVLVALLPQEAEATNFFQRIIAWSEDVFSFINPVDKTIQEETYVFHTDNPGLQEVYDKVTSLGITIPVVPTWLPDGYELVECELIENPTKKHLTVEFSNGNTTAVFLLKFSFNNVTSTYYKNGEILRKVEMHGITHTILRNQDLLTAVWTTDNIECSISIDCPEDTLIWILESIYIMEDN